MAVDLMGHAFAPAAGEQVAFQEAAAAGLRSLELLASSLSPRASGQPPALGPIADQAVSRFRRVINLLDRTGHARFRRAPAVAPVDYDSPPASPPPRHALSPVVSQPAVVVAAEVEAKPQKSLTLDFTKPAVEVAKAAAKAAPAVSATSTSFLSSVTAGGGGEGSVSKGQSLAAVSSGKPPLPKRKQHPCTTAAGAVPCSKTTAAAAAHPDQSAAPKCHCSKKRRKHARGATRTVRVPAPASTASDIPADAFSWRKYGQKPIKGSPFPRGYYRCSTVKGCPARKHVERDAADPATLVVTYEGDHRHDAAAPALAGAGATHNRRA